MKAAVNTRYGPPEVIAVREVPKPEPGAGEVLVKVHATTVNRSDSGQLRAHPFFVRLMTGLFRPRRTILGMDFAGEVEASGPGVTSFAPGDRVFGTTPRGYGGHAEYFCMSESGPLATMPAGLPFDEAVVCEGAVYADTYLRAFALGQGDKILIYGASGAIGTAAVQLAKSYGAEVTAVTDTRHLDLVRSLGAGRVIDYTTQDYTQSDDRFDYIFDAVGKVSYFHCRRLLKPGGTFAASDFGPYNQNLLLLLWAGLTRSKRIIFPLPKESKEFVEFLADRMRAGEFRAIIDRKYPLEEIVAAYRYVETGQKTGIVVIEVVPRGPDVHRQAGRHGHTQADRIRRVATEEVEIVDYDPVWPESFACEREHLLTLLPAGIVRRIEHFGSTAVPGLAAKPIIDMLVEVRDLAEVRERVVPVLGAESYEYFWRPTFGDDKGPFYAWFIKRDAMGRRTHHIHMVEAGAEFAGHWERLLFRDHLIAHPEVAAEYARLKRRLAAESADRVAYTEAKGEFIERVTAEAKQEAGV